MNCDECNGKAIVDEARGEVVCSDCGLVVQPTLVASDPIVGGDGNLVGYGPALSVNRGASLATQLSTDMRDGRGRKITDISRQQLSRLSRLDGRVIRREERVTRRLYAMTASLCIQVGLSNDPRDRAFFICKQAYKNQVLRGQEFNVLVAASVYLAAREARRFIDLKTLTTIAGVSRRRPQQQVMRGQIRIKRVLGLEIKSKSPLEMLPAVASTLDLPQQEQRMAIAILSANEASTKPEADLAGALYMATNGRLSQKSIAAACGTTEVSLRNRTVKFSKGLSTSKTV